MIKHGVVIVIGSLILVVGLTGLALLQTGVIYPTASIGPVNLPEVKSSEPTPESGQQAAGPAGAPALQPAPPLGPGRGLRLKAGGKRLQQTWGLKNRLRSLRLEKASALIRDKLRLSDHAPPREAPRLTGSAGRRPANQHLNATTNTNRDRMPTNRLQVKPQNPL